MNRQGSSTNRCNNGGEQPQTTVNQNEKDKTVTLKDSSSVGNLAGNDDFLSVHLLSLSSLWSHINQMKQGEGKQEIKRKFRWVGFMRRVSCWKTHQQHPYQQCKTIKDINATNKSNPPNQITNKKKPPKHIYYSSSFVINNVYIYVCMYNKFKILKMKQLYLKVDKSQNFNS